MSKGTEKTKKSNAGRPSTFKADYIRQARIACEEMGATDCALAKLFNVTKETVRVWKRDNPELSAAIQEGRDEWNTNKIEKALASRAQGYRYTETVTELQTDEETGEQRMVEVKKTRKFIPPDTRAIHMWLLNRKASRWQDRKAVQVSGDPEQPIQHEHKHAMDDEAVASIVESILQDVGDDSSGSDNSEA